MAPETPLIVQDSRNDRLDAAMDMPPPFAAWTRRLPDDYWEQSRRPLAGLLFIAPLLAVYEAGVVLLGSSMDRNGVDVWLRTMLDGVGLGNYLLLPGLTVGILLAWHHTTRLPWRVPRGVLGAMAVESVVLAVCLRWILWMQNVLFPLSVGAAELAAKTGHAGGSNVACTPGNLIMFLGAGIYEELLFRLILLGGALWALRALGVARGRAVLLAVVATSLLFSAAHYVGPYREPLQAFSFLFRFIAGVFFCALFVYRGFGVAVGAHAGYDILIVLF